MILADSIQIYLKTTETCNLNCHHCFTNGKTGSKIFFDPIKVSQFLIELTKKNNVKLTRILYHGGEPMLAPLKDLYKFHELTCNSIEGVSYGIQTNLVYSLTQQKLDFFKNVIGFHGIGTSWDSDIRFGSSRKENKEAELNLWENNVRTLSDMGFESTLMVSLSKNIVQNFKPVQIIEYAISLGFKFILFERLTSDGNASLNKTIFPSNTDLDNWILEMYHETMKHQLFKKIGNMFLEELVEASLFRVHKSNRCRGCEQKIITINANGTIAGCPNSATKNTWGHIDENPDTFLKSSDRIGAICKEKVRNNLCYSCPVNDICNGDCYKLAWDGDVCAAPKSLMKLLKENSDRESSRRLLI